MKKKLNIEELIRTKFCGFLPIYGKDGSNGSRLLFSGSPPKYEPIQVRTLLNNLASYFQKDIKLIRKYVYGLTGLRSMNPLPITSEILLVPFKTRKPIGKDDGATGYIFSAVIVGVEEIASDEKTNVYIILKDKSKILILESAYTANRRLKTTGMLKDIVSHDTVYTSSSNIINDNNIYTIIQETNEAYEKPATKGDIALLSKSILNLVHSLKE